MAKTTVNQKYLRYQTKEEVEAILDAVRPHAEIAVGDLVAETLSSDTITKLKALRKEGSTGAVILISHGETLVPANVYAYGGTFMMYFTLMTSDANGLSAEIVCVEANANGSRWTVTRRNITSEIDSKLSAADSDDPLSLLDD